MDDTDKWLGKAVKTLQDSESLYRKLFESLDEAVQICELIFNDDGKPVDVLMLNVNPAYEKHSGLKKDEVIGKSIKSVLSVVEQIWLDRYAEVVHEGKSMHFEEYNEGLDRWFDVHASPLGGNRFAAVFSDITERKKAEDALKEGEERYREFFANPIVGFGLCKVVTNENGKPIDYIYLEINGAFEDFTGLKKEEVINKGVREVLPDDADNLVSIFGPVGLTGGRIKVEVPIPTLGRIYEVDAYSPSKNHFIALFTDITERKKAEETLRESEVRFRSVLDNSLDALYRVNLKTGQYDYLSPAFEDVVGFSPKEFTSMTSEEAMSIIHPDDLSVAKESLARLEIEGHVKVDYRVRDSRGKYRWLSNHMSLIRDADGQKLYRDGTIRNITEQKKVEEELRQARDHLEEQVEQRTAEIEEAYQSLKESELKAKQRSDLLDITHEAIFVRDTNDKITFWNRGAEELYGWSKKEALGKISHDLLKTEFPEPLEQIKLDSIKNGRWDGELIHTKRDGTKINMLSRWSLQGDKSEPKGFLEVNVDITESKKVEEEINQKNKILDEINTIFRATITHVDEEEFGKTCLAVCEKLTGSEISFIGEINEYGRFDSIAVSENGWKACKLVKEQGAESADDNVIRGIRSRPIEEKEILVFNDPTNSPYWSGLPEGHYRIDSFLGAPLIYRNEVIGLVALANKRDGYSQEDIEVMKVITVAITESLMFYRALKQLEDNRAELKETITELERSNKELRSFAYITSHDLQEPLRTMGSFAGLLKRRYGGQLDSDADEFLDYMTSGAARMKYMVQGLLDYSRVGTRGEEFKEFNAEDALNIALINLKSSIEECNVEITHDSLPDIGADESQISRVFQNLIGNAIKFRKPQISPRIHISAHKDEEKNEWVFSVEDNGIGLESEYKDRIFEVFKRLHPIGEYQGVGIGLAIVKRIIERHGGRVWVESVFGKGSTFYFTIPVK